MGASALEEGVPDYNSARKRPAQKEKQKHLFVTCITLLVSLILKLCDGYQIMCNLISRESFSSGRDPMPRSKENPGHCRLEFYVLNHMRFSWDKIDSNAKNC